MSLTLDRLEFLGMWEFLKHVIPNSEESGKNCLFIRIDEGKVIFTGGGPYASKKVILIQPNDIEKNENSKKVPETFMIPKSSVLGFETLLKEDKKICKKLSKSGDLSHLCIHINDNLLVSHVNSLEYSQPGYQFKDLETYFSGKRSSLDNNDFFLPPVDVSNVMSGFKKSKQVKACFVQGGESIYFIQPASEYEAVLTLPPEEDQEPPMTGDDED